MWVMFGDPCFVSHGSHYTPQELFSSPKELFRCSQKGSHGEFVYCKMWNEFGDTVCRQKLPNLFKQWDNKKQKILCFLLFPLSLTLIFLHKKLSERGKPKSFLKFCSYEVFFTYFCKQVKYLLCLCLE